MLVLSRDRFQKVILEIPPSTQPRVVEVVVAEIRAGKRVRLGFVADKSIAIMREELCKSAVQSNIKHTTATAAPKSSPDGPCHTPPT